VNFRDDAIAACRYAAERLGAAGQSLVIGEYLI